MYSIFTKHKIEQSDRLPFDPAEYSKFKFGDTALAKKFAIELSDSFIENHRSLLLNTTDIVIVPSPYNAIPTASGLMSNYFKDAINRFLHKNNKTLLLESKIHRYNTYSVDYSQLSYEQRLNLMESDTYHFHEAFLNNKTCLFIDDIRVTGSHEKIIKNLLEANHLKGNFIFVYYAAFHNKSIAPNLESFLNTFSVKSITDIVSIIQSPTFSPNTRIIKYILNSEMNPEISAIAEADKDILAQMVAYALHNNYHVMPEYKSNFQLLVRYANMYN